MLPTNNATFVKYLDKELAKRCYLVDHALVPALVPSPLDIVKMTGYKGVWRQSVIGD